MALPILTKVTRKTLLLQEYTLSKGHTRGLARACQFFDSKYINRVVFDNCGIDDQEFADILKGLSFIKEIKSIVYKMNTFGENSLKNLQPILKHRLPYHLVELKLIDCQMYGSSIRNLIDMLLDTGSQLRSLALVNSH